MKTGIELITLERIEQIEKHGRTIELDTLINNEGQIRSAVNILLFDRDILGTDENRINLCSTMCPNNWNKEIFIKMLNKPLKERMIIAGALLAVEIDRMNIIGE